MALDVGFEESIFPGSVDGVECVGDGRGDEEPYQRANLEYTTTKKQHH